MDISNSTLSGNSATSGGGIYSQNQVTVTVTNSTLSGNSANSGGGIYYDFDGSSGGTVILANTVLKTGASGENIYNFGGQVVSQGYNLSNDNGGGFLTGPEDQINTDPMPGPLQDNGSPTFTHALLPGSPAIDTGDPNFTPPPLYDQRDSPFVRAFNGRIDIGSFEVQPTPFAYADGDSHSNTDSDAKPNAYSDPMHREMYANAKTRSTPHPRP